MGTPQYIIWHTRAFRNYPTLIRIIDNALVADALEATGLTAQHEVVELALKTLIQIKRQEAIRAFRGQLPWDGDLESMRTSRSFK